jgi:DUF1680 family protein
LKIKSTVSGLVDFLKPGAWRLLRLGGVAIWLVAATAQAITVTLSADAPAPSTWDVYHLTGATRDGLNVNDGGTYADGAANDAFTYVAADRASQGQTFTTGGTTNRYTIKAVWLRHPGYSNNAAQTYWRMNGGGTLTVRVTDPALAGTGSFALTSETYTTTGAEGWPGSFNSANGSSNWLKFTFANPITLQSNKAYGFDVTSSSGLCFFETLGTSNNPYAGGSAYKGNMAGTPDTTLVSLTGDRVFLVELLPGAQTNEIINVTAYTAPLTAADSFPVERVRLLDSRFKQNQDLHRTNYLAWLDADRLLYPFRANAGLTQPPGVTHLGGWEGGSGFTAVRGHMAGHYLTAASKMFAATGDTNYLPKIQYLVQELRECQDALSTSEIAAGRVYGYLSGFPSSYFTTLETNPTAAQVPFYTIHKILAGLVDAYRYTSNHLALDIASGMADYHQWRVAQLSAAQIEAMFRTDNGNSEEWGGMNEALTDLYLLSHARGDTNAVRHLNFAKVFHRDWFINPLDNNQDPLNGLHANTHVPQVVGFAHTASVLSTNDPERDRLYTAADNFWHLVLNQHWLVLGGNSYGEHFSTPGRETGTGGNALAWNTAETCNTHNMLKLTRQLFMHNPAPEYADYFEHALYNHILASLETNAGMMTYFVPMNPGHFKTYNQPEGSCWCCTGTGIENTPRYNEGIYFHKDNVLWVNLFIPSVLDWRERGLTVQLNTQFPASNLMTLTVQCPQPTNAAVRIRIPSWITTTPTVKINGVSPGLTPAAGTYLELNRTWANGDTVELTLPMGLRVDHSMDDASQVSLFYGPILLAGDLGTNGLPVSDQAQDQWDYSGVATVAAPVLMGDHPDNPAGWVLPAGSPLAFQADCAFANDPVRSTVQLRPFYDVHHTRYAVYWKLVAPASYSVWSGNAGSPNWSLAGNWSSVPTNQCAVQFGPGAGGTLSNDLALGSILNGIHFPAGAGGFVLNGNRITLQGDILNDSTAAQRINLPLQLSGNLPWIMNARTGNLTLGGEVSGQGSLVKSGAQTLTVLSNCTFSGPAWVGEGTLELGNGGTSGDLGDRTVTVDAGAALAFNRGDAFAVTGPIGGAGSVVKRGSGTMMLAAALSNAGSTLIEAGLVQIATQQVQALSHRWSFNNSLADSVGTNNATLVEVGPSNTTLTASSVTLSGGARASSDYVSLGSGLLPKSGSPATIELWATHVSARSWSRVFDLGSSDTDNLFMCWSQGTDVNTDRVEWRDLAMTTVNNSCAPYAPGVEQHIVMVIEPGAGGSGTTRVTWYAAPAGNASLGAARGTFDTANTLAELNDVNFWLGRSEYGGDATANASYNEVRLWSRAFNAGELQQLHLLGPDNVGTLATSAIVGRLSPQSDLMLQSGAQVLLGNTTQHVASLAGAGGSAVGLNGGQIIIGNGTNAATFAGSVFGTGSLVINGTLRLVGNASIAASLTVTNHGTLDIMTWNGSLPAGFVNQGTVLTRSLIQLGPGQVNGSDFMAQVQGYSGHVYQLQACDNLSSPAWVNVGSAVAGTNAPILLVHPGGAGITRRFYRLSVSP